MKAPRTLPAPPATSLDQGRRLLAFLSRHRARLSPLLILTHDFPDPDALASAFALQYLAQTAFDIQARIAYGGELGRTENRMMVRLLRIPLQRMRKTWLKKVLEHRAGGHPAGLREQSIPWR